jgi:hypothetical protein
MRPPSGGTTGVGTVYGNATNYTADASGNYTITFYKDVDALLNQGWSIVKTGNTTPDFLVDLTGIAPSATLNTYGPATILSPTADYASVKPLSCDLIFGGTFGSETLTVKIIVTFSDGTTQTTTSFTATGTGTTAFTNAQLRSTFYKNGVTISSISFSCASSLAAGSSIATLEVKSHGIQS